MGEECPCPVQLRTGCCPVEEFLGLLALAQQELHLPQVLERPGWPVLQERLP